MVFVQHIKVTIRGVCSFLMLYFYEPNYAVVWFLQVERTDDFIFLRQTYWTLIWKSLSFKGGKEGSDEALCLITYAQFPVCSNSLRGRKLEDVRECCVSEHRDDRSLAGVYVDTLTVLLLHYTRFRKGPHGLLRNICARAKAFHVRGILVSSRRSTKLVAVNLSKEAAFHKQIC
jgi:hypothetical protein